MAARPGPAALGLEKSATDKKAPCRARRAAHSRPQDRLARNGTASHRVPHRLGGDTVAAAIHFPFEYMHFFHVA